MLNSTIIEEILLLYIENCKYDDAVYFHGKQLLGVRNSESFAQK